jgi:hypothetical protein
MSQTCQERKSAPTIAQSEKWEVRAVLAEVGERDFRSFLGSGLKASLF